MSSHQTPLENRHAQALRLARWAAAPGQSTTVPPGESLPVFSASPETHHRLPTGLRGEILQAPWPNHAWRRRRGSPSPFQAVLSGTAHLVGPYRGFLS